MSLLTIKETASSGPTLISDADIQSIVTAINGLAAGTTPGVYTGTFNGVVGGVTPAAGTFTAIVGTTASFSDDVTIATGKAIKTDTTTAHTALFQAYDVDGTAYKTFATLTNGNTPSFAIAAPAGGTVAIDGAVIGGVAPAAGSFTTGSFTGNVTITDVNVILSASTGTKIGTATGQKLAFYNSTPVIQPAGAAVTTAGFTAGAGAAVLVDSTFTGNTGSTAYHISDIVANLKSLGLLAA